jgi:hypothetical protein
MVIAFPPVPLHVLNRSTTPDVRQPTFHAHRARRLSEEIAEARAIFVTPRYCSYHGPLQSAAEKSAFVTEWPRLRRRNLGVR